MDTIPVVKNEEYEMNIDNLGSNGEGVGRIDGFTIFVDGALAGERIKVKILKVAKNYAYGKLVHLIQKVSHRTEPRCPHFKHCGGCQLQHLSYEGQLAYKTQLVQDALKRIGGLKGISVHPAIGMVDPWRYRNKVQFPIGFVRNQLALGFYAPRSHDLVDIDQCPIQHSINDTVNSLIRKFINTYNVPVYREETHQGILRHVVTKVGFKSRQLMVILVTNGTQLPHRSELIALLREGIPSITSIIQNIQSQKTNVVLGDENITLWGQDYILDAVGDLKFKISPLSFFQINPIQTEILYNKALEYASLTGTERVVDVYSGIGTISLFLARRAANVYGIEVIPQAILDANENAAINKITNAEFIEGEAESVLPRLASLGLNPEVIVLDPPRKGCDPKLLDAILKMNPGRIVYISCNPATLARDLKALTADSYQVKDVQPVDMFPHTVHVESIILMTYCGSEKK